MTTTEHVQIEPPAPQDAPSQCPARASLISASLPPEDRYALTLNMRKRYQKTLKVAAELAKEMGMIQEATIHELMNLFVNLGLETLKNESLRRQGYK